MVVWMREDPIGSYVWVLGPQLVWTVWEGFEGVVLMEEVCSWVWALRFQKTLTIPSVLFPVCGLVCEISAAAPAASHNALLHQHKLWPSRTGNPVQLSLLYYWSRCFITAIEMNQCNQCASPGRQGKQRSVKCLKTHLVLSHRPIKEMEGCILDMELRDYHTFIHLFDSYRHSPI
jgi:hypothetical protein